MRTDRTVILWADGEITSHEGTPDDLRIKARNRRKVKHWWSHLRKGDIPPVYAEATSARNRSGRPNWTAEYGPHRGVLRARRLAGLSERESLRLPPLRSFLAWAFGAG